MDTEPKTDGPERVINGQNPSATGNSLLGDRRMNDLTQSNYVLPGVPLEELADKLASGMLLTEIAPLYGVTPQAVGKYARTKLGPHYSAIRELGTEVRLHKSREAIGVARDQVSLARAREEFAADRWFAEREHPERWGQRQEITHRSVDLASELERAHERLVGSGRSELATTGRAASVDITPVMHTHATGSGHTDAALDNDTPGGHQR